MDDFMWRLILAIIFTMPAWIILCAIKAIIKISLMDTEELDKLDNE